MSTTAPDVDVVAILMSEDEPPCAADGCSAVARWAVRCSRCRTDWHFCDAHRTTIDMWANIVPGAACSVESGGCGAVMPFPLPWRPI